MGDIDPVKFLFGQPKRVVLKTGPIGRDGTIFSYPVLVRPDPANAGVRIDKKRVFTLRPETLAASLKQAQSRDPKARPERFIETLFDAYNLLKMPDGKESTGMTSVTYQKLPEGWRIVHDHSSAAAN